MKRCAWSTLSHWLNYEQKPYTLSMALSSALMGGLGFVLWTPSVGQKASDQEKAITVTLVSQKPSAMPKTPKPLTDRSKKPLPDNDSSSLGAKTRLDLAFYPTIEPPRLLSPLPKRFPEEARKRSIPAIVYAEIWIEKDGWVSDVRIIGVRLLKKVPPAISKRIEKEFSRETIQLLKKARFSPTIIDGQAVAVKMTETITYRLTD